MLGKNRSVTHTVSSYQAHIKQTAEKEAKTRFGKVKDEIKLTLDKLTPKKVAKLALPLVKNGEILIKSIKSYQHFKDALKEEGEKAHPDATTKSFIHAKLRLLTNQIEKAVINLIGEVAIEAAVGGVSTSIETTLIERATNPALYGLEALLKTGKKTAKVIKDCATKALTELNYKKTEKQQKFENLTDVKETFSFRDLAEEVETSREKVWDEIYKLDKQCLKQGDAIPQEAENELTKAFENWIPEARTFDGMPKIEEREKLWNIFRKTVASTAKKMERLAKEKSLKKNEQKGIHDALKAFEGANETLRELERELKPTETTKTTETIDRKLKIIKDKIDANNNEILQLNQELSLLEIQMESNTREELQNQRNQLENDIHELAPLNTSVKEFRRDGKGITGRTRVNTERAKQCSKALVRSLLVEEKLAEGKSTKEKEQVKILIAASKDPTFQDEIMEIYFGRNSQKDIIGHETRPSFPLPPQAPTAAPTAAPAAAPAPPKDLFSKEQQKIFREIVEGMQQV